MIWRLLTFLACLILSACAAPASVEKSAFIAAAPKSILVVPVVNKSVDVDAPNYMLSTLTVPIAEKGYYVFPVNTVKTILEHEGYYEPERIHAASPADLAKLFGADAILYVQIERWDARYVVLATTVTVDFDYKLVAKDGTEIWKARQQMQYTPQVQSSGSALATLIAMAAQAAIARAAPNYMPLANQANGIVFLYGPNAWPNGPYRTGQ